VLIPIGTDRRRHGPPWATIILIAANCYVFLVLQDRPGAGNFALVWTRFEWWMPVTYMFTHGGFGHLLGNMIFLWVFGPHAEDALGRGRFILLYFSAGFASAGLHVLSSLVLYPQELAVGLVGASGAIMGVVSLFVLRFHGVRVRFFIWLILPYVFSVRALWVGIAYLGMDLTMALMAIGSEGMGGVAHWAHVGGFLAGGVWAWALRLPEEGTHEIHHAEARKLVAAGAWRSAAKLLEERIAARPGDAELHGEAAVSYEQLQDGREQAIEHWNEHLRLLLLARGYDAAVERFRALVERYRPHDFDPAVLMRIGAAAETRSADDLALPAWMGVAQAHPDSAQAPAAALRAARLLLRRGRNDAARELLEHISRTWPHSEEAMAAAQARRVIEG